MGYYLPTPYNTYKAEYLINTFGAEKIDIHLAKVIIREDPEKAIIVVIDNVLYEAAGYAYSERELDELSDPSDVRSKVILSMNKNTVLSLLGLSK
jgi:hypothetical protein